MAKFLPGVRACKRPKMSNHRGRTWDQATVTLPGGEQVTCYTDTTWGARFYFPFGDRWYSAPVNYQICGSLDFDLRPERWELPKNGWDLPKYIRG